MHFKSHSTTDTQPLRRRIHRPPTGSSLIAPIIMWSRREGFRGAKHPMTWQSVAVSWQDQRGSSKRNVSLYMFADRVHQKINYSRSFDALATSRWLKLKHQTKRVTYRITPKKRWIRLSKTNRRGGGAKLVRICVPGKIMGRANLNFWTSDTRRVEFSPHSQPSTDYPRAKSYFNW